MLIRGTAVGVVVVLIGGASADVRAVSSLGVSITPPKMAEVVSFGEKQSRVTLGSMMARVISETRGNSVEVSSDIVNKHVRCRS